MISGCSHEVGEKCTLLGYYTVRSGNFYQRFGTNQNIDKKLPLLAA